MRHVTKYSPAKTGEYPSHIPQLSKDLGCCQKYLKDNKHSNYLHFDFLEQIHVMPADKYSSIFLCQMEAIVYLP